MNNTTNDTIIEKKNIVKELLENNGIIEDIAAFCKERYYFVTNDVQSDDDTLFKGFGNIFEELSEGMKGSHSEYETIDHLADMIVFSINSLVQMNVNPTRDILTFLIREEIPYGYDTDEVLLVKREVLSTMILIFLRGTSKCKPKFDVIKDFYIELILANIRAIEDMGYSAKDVLTEVLLEIASREQCPIQAERGRVPGEKWEKNKNQDPRTLYKASYTHLTKQEVS